MMMKPGQNEAFFKSWTLPTVRIGFWTLLLACAASFMPSVLLFLIHGVFPPFEIALKAWGLIIVAYGAFHVIEPISFYSVYGLTGTYISFLSGNNGNIRLPASSTAQDIIGVEPGSDQAEIVSTLAICGSVIVNLVILFVGVLFGTQIIAMIPPAIKDGMANYILPSLYGAIFAQSAIHHPKIAIFAFALCCVCSWLGLSSWLRVILAVFVTIAVTRILYQKGILD
ncbi:MAG: hypothetical protein HFG20_03030 [Anaerotruncus sp.]|nr:hypothetical protein [Anaerotruncus sp.]